MPIAKNCEVKLRRETIRENIKSVPTILLVMFVTISA
jgi:hypothetical protein